MSAADLPAVVARRMAAAIAATSAALHLVMLGHVGTPAAAALIAAMAGACLYCAWELWRSSATRAWTLVALMNLAMVAVHLPMSGSHHLTHVPVEAVVPQPTTMMLATVLSITEVLIAVAVLCYRTRGNARALERTE
ncbi:hypothetical protein DVS77_10275 [Mycolicibacterium moriokaense]|nr:hypothetical protein DVS77_10275 [Mycolicibacterium moriokaense]